MRMGVFDAREVANVFEIRPKEAQLRNGTEAGCHESGKKPAMLDARAAVPGWGSLSGGMDRSRAV